MNIEISKKMRSLQPSAIREILKYAGNPGVISLAAGDPAPESLPVAQLQEIVAEMLQKDPMRALLYAQSEGYPPLREHLRQFVKEFYNSIGDDDDLMVTSGAQQTMDLVAKVLCNEGDTVICENPSFIGALNAFRSYGANLVGVPMDDQGMLLEPLEQAILANPNTKFIYVIPNFQNPTGLTTSLARRKGIYALAQAHNLVILEDNPYGDLRFEGESVPSIKSMDTDGRVIYAGSFSKILSSGIRIGYMVAPKEIFGKLTVGKQCTDVHTSMLGQLLCLGFLEKYDMRAHIEGLQKTYREKCGLMLSEMDRLFPKSVTYTRPEGGLFLWCTMPQGYDGGAFAKQLVEEQKVCVVPGSTFFTDQSQPSSSFRMNFSKPLKEEIVAGVERVATLLRANIGE